MQKKSEDCVSRCLSRREAEEIDSFSMCQLLYVQNIFFFFHSIDVFPNSIWAATKTDSTGILFFCILVQTKRTTNCSRSISECSMYIFL